MIIIPAIDLKDGQCVRLKQGLMEDSTIFSDNPVKVAQEWVELGAKRLHLVDLNGAFAGKPMNHSVIMDITQQYPNLEVQIGGGIRTLQTAEKYINTGIDYLIIGSKAVTNPEFVSELCREFENKIIVGLDANDGFVAIDGWATKTDKKVSELAKRFEQDGVNSIIYTDIARDGMMQGVNYQATAELAKFTNLPIIASGGITNMDDIKNLKSVEDNGIIGAITGRAIYEGTLDFVEAQSYAN
ncbi:Phosphoribosylformimino-5-aminoimidazole carboxamide ribotide isomerase [hydrothermal vent metagenome]|uniref:1-(5-phosphoribosyl)-5-[(5-phosphoribosylamino)methylideneamino]imidazole-4-carboxamideisomerase n=1 Tax=hydrothermal vent metagenome TaxID=652676 RepID=A0A1W1C697_9ZZZZ